MSDKLPSVNKRMRFAEYVRNARDECAELLDRYELSDEQRQSLERAYKHLRTAAFNAGRAQYGDVSLQRRLAAITTESTK